MASNGQQVAYLGSSVVAAWHPGTRATSNVGNRIIAVVRSLWLSSTTRSRGGGVCKRTRWKCRLYVVGVLLAPSWFPPCLQTSRRQCRFRIGKKWPAILIGRNHIWSCMTRLGPRHIAVFRSRSDMAYIVLSIFQQGLRVHELLADGQKHTLPTGIPEISRP